MYTVQMNVSIDYEIHIGPGLIDCCGTYIRNVFSPCKAAVITDSNVQPLYAARVEKSLQDAGFDTIEFVFPAGEHSKNLNTLSDILEFLAENEMTRSDIVVALGGGVTGDMAGFAAAVYARGIPFVQIPTTLLAAVDSSVGGKTAVDLKAGKNLAGAFHQPSLVLTDTQVIADLPPHLLSEGAAESIKHGVLKDKQLFSWMSAANWKEMLPEIILRNIEIKKSVVMQDEQDKGLRNFLNLGHTFGHAIEKLSDFSVPHGFGVAIGMAIAAGAAGKAEICRAIIRANTNCGLPSCTAYDAHTLALAALTDKKRHGQTIDLILPEEIGLCRMVKTPVDELEKLFEKGIAAIKEIL